MGPWSREGGEASSATGYAAFGEESGMENAIAACPWAGFAVLTQSVKGENALVWTWAVK